MNLADISTKAPKEVDKQETKDKMLLILQKISEKQRVLYAQSKYSLLIVLQGLDGSGKDGAISSVFSGVNPLGCQVKAFKAPTEEEKAHDFLWRIHKHTPAKGMIQVFNRSHYEDILVPEVEQFIDEDNIKRRYKMLNSFEELLQGNNTHILKFYLHISKEMQSERLLERTTNPEKFWKHDDGDFRVASKFDNYLNSYEKIFKNCDKPDWHIIPSDQKWYKEYLIASIILEKLNSLDLQYPPMVKKTLL
jgi:PPK2 family polyphosphate:nucleotide phosphotransferase